MMPQADAGAVPMGRRSRAGRALVVIWVLVLLGLAGGAAALQVLGPPRVAPAPIRAPALPPRAGGATPAASAPAATTTAVPATSSVPAAPEAQPKAAPATPSVPAAPKPAAPATR